MKFCEAMDSLKSGKKVTRKDWSNDLYFILKEGMVQSFQPAKEYYCYDENIMISEGWLIDDHKDPMRFCDIIPYLRKGMRAKMKDWEDGYIYLDEKDGLVYSHMNLFPYRPTIRDFVSDDWIEV